MEYACVFAPTEKQKSDKELLRMKWKKYISIVVVIFLMAITLACRHSEDIESAPKEATEDTLAEENYEDNHSLEETEDEEAVYPEMTESDFKALEVNEMGQVMVLMYHHIREPEAEWSRTPDNFREDLKNLYEANYRPVRLEDYATGNINTPAGKTPVVLTFDDGNQNNFNMIEDEAGEWIIDPDSAVGILMDFHEKHPDFMPHATFFINGGTPFGQADWVDFKLNFLVDNGMDIGNHTETHRHLGDVDADTLQRELGRIVQLVQKYVPDYEVNTFALPFGSRPQNEELRNYLVAGEFEDVSYHHVAVLEVGWDPYHSPYHKNFDGSAIRRVRASETKVDGVGMYDWMNAFETGSRHPFISDGNPERIVVPDWFSENINPELSEDEIFIYHHP